MAVAEVETPGERSYRWILTERVEELWGWLERWGHVVERIDLSALPITELVDLELAEAQRVQTLAAEWEAWW